MESLDKLCRLCADDMDVSINLENCGDMTEIQKFFNFVSFVNVYNFFLFDYGYFSH